MSTDPSSANESRDSEATLDYLLDRWEELSACGEATNSEELCAEHPELLSAFEARLADLNRVGELMKEEGASDPAAELRQPFELIKDEEVQLTLHLSDLSLFDLGGMGIVGRAKDSELQRDVAVKFMKPNTKSPLNQERFLNEAKVTGRMAHPGVLPVYGYGTTTDQVPFYAMRYVNGPTFEEAINDYHRERKHQTKRQQMSALRKLLTHFVSVAYTIAYAHERGVVHCDLKPQNILLGAFGETYVIDWGLAVGMSPSKGNFTEVAERREAHGAGTEGYSHPDQLVGKTAPNRSWDVYGLGAVLFKLLTNCATNDRRSRISATGTNDGNQFARPRTLDKGIPAPLETICLQALGQSEEHRYERASELADDVQRYLAGEPVAGHSEVLWERVMRWQRSHQGATKIAGVLLLTLIVVLVASSWSLWRFAENTEVKTRESLETAVKFAAQAVSLEMNNRWQALDLAARDPKLVQTLSELDLDSDAGISDVLQVRIRHHRNAFRGLNTSSWFLCNAVGRQVARSPVSNRSTGNYYAHRDYFHGNGLDYEATQVGEPLPGDPPYIEQAHHSMVYRSTSDQTLKVAYSVPVFLNSGTDTERFVGVICMSVELGAFSFTGEGMLEDHVLILVDLRNDRLDGEPRNGLILHHPDIENKGAMNAVDDRPRLPGELVNRLKTEASFYLENFVDPVSPLGGAALAAFAKVVVRSGNGNLRDTEWAVIVKEERRRNRL